MPHAEMCGGSDCVERTSSFCRGAGALAVPEVPPIRSVEVAETKKRAKRRPASIAELIVRRGALRRFEMLKRATADLPVTLSWDRRLEERRTSPTGVARERRQSDRRGKSPFTWEVADFLVVGRRDEGS